MTAHEHEWRSFAHMDGCHFFITMFACACDATARAWVERDVLEDPYSRVWFDDSCARCAALAAGAKPIREFDVVEANA